MYKNIILACLFLSQLFITSQSAWARRAEHQPQSNLALRFSDNLFTVSADLNLSQDEAARVMQIAHKAFDFDISYNNWQNQNILLAPISLVFQSSFQHRAVTRGAISRVTIRSEFLHDTWLYNILAHEFTHLQDFREVRKNIHHFVPRYILEGRAWLDGFMFRRQLKLSVNVLDINAVKTMSVMTSQQARVFFERPFEKAPQYEVGGYFFVNFLRTSWEGQGYPDAQVRLANAIADLNNGGSFAETFARQFNHTLKQAQTSFCRYLDETQNDPTKRFAGTELESIYKLAMQTNTQPAEEDNDCRSF